MDLSQRKEQFSFAYIRAVASVAGYVVYVPEVDDDSVDLGFAARGGNGTTRSPRLEIQAKCTAQDLINGGHISYPLKKKNYDDLRGTNLMVPRILVVVLVPTDDPSEWLTQTTTELVMRRCGFWVSLRTLPDSDNETAVTVSVPLQQCFTVKALSELMHGIQVGAMP